MPPDSEVKTQQESKETEDHLNPELHFFTKQRPMMVKEAAWLFGQQFVINRNFKSNNIKITRFYQWLFSRVNVLAVTHQLFL